MGGRRLGVLVVLSLACVYGGPALAGEITWLGRVPGSLGSFPLAVSGDGSVVVGAALWPDPLELDRPIVWNPRTGWIVPILDPDGIGWTAADVSADGRIFAGSAASGGMV